MKRIPNSYKKDIDTAIRILKDAGCTEIFIFGSIIHGKIHNDSDIDIAIKGCPAGLFFRLLGQLIKYLNRSVDLVDLDKQASFSKFLKEHGELVRVA